MVEVNEQQAWSRCANCGHWHPRLLGCEMAPNFPNEAERDRVIVDNTWDIKQLQGGLNFVMQTLMQIGALKMQNAVMGADGTPMTPMIVPNDATEMKEQQNGGREKPETGTTNRESSGDESTEGRPVDRRASAKSR